MMMTSAPVAASFAEGAAVPPVNEAAGRHAISFNGRTSVVATRRATRCAFRGELLQRLGAEVVAANSVPVLDQIGTHVQALHEGSVPSRR